MALFPNSPLSGENTIDLSKPPKNPTSSTPPLPPSEDTALKRQPLRLIPSEPCPEPSLEAPAAYLDAGSMINGTLVLDKMIRIDGKLQGEIRSKDCVWIGHEATIVAKIQAKSVIVQGQVNGDIVAKEKIILLPTASVLGNLASPIIQIHEGAKFEGHCTMKLSALEAAPRDDARRDLAAPTVQAAHGPAPVPAAHARPAPAAAPALSSATPPPSIPAQAPAQAQTVASAQPAQQAVATPGRKAA